MLKALFLFVSFTLLSVPAVANSVFVSESGPLSLPVVTFTNSPGSTFLKSASATAVACPNTAITSGCWRIDVVVQGTILVNWGTFGVQLYDPGTGTLSDSFGSEFSVPNYVTDTSTVSFQLFSLNASGILGGQASVCQLGMCSQAVENGTFQAGDLGLTVGDSTNGINVTNNSFDVFLQSGPLVQTPEPSTLSLLSAALSALALFAGRKSPGILS